MPFLSARTLSLALCLTCAVLATAQSAEPNDIRLAKIRALYDTPFRRNLGSFDCALQLDWNHHVTAMFGSVPPAIKPVTDRLQTIQRRVLVDRSGATISTVPKVADFSDLPAAATLEQSFEAIAAAGMSTWATFATDLVLPNPPTQYHFESDGPATRLSMAGPGRSSTLSLLPDGRLTGGISDKPQPFHFSMEFIAGPQGFLVSAMQSGRDSFESSFAYRYETVGGFQLPTHFTVHSLVGENAREVWEIELTDCKVNRSITLEVGPPHDPSPSTPEVNQTLPQ